METRNTIAREGSSVQIESVRAQKISFSEYLRENRDYIFTFLIIDDLEQKGILEYTIPTLTSSFRLDFEQMFFGIKFGTNPLSVFTSLRNVAEENSDWTIAILKKGEKYRVIAKVTGAEISGFTVGRDKLYTISSCGEDSSEDEVEVQKLKKKEKKNKSEESVKEKQKKVKRRDEDRKYEKQKSAEETKKEKKSQAKAEKRTDKSLSPDISEILSGGNKDPDWAKMVEEEEERRMAEEQGEITDEGSKSETSESSISSN